jgi:hypothetical protein
VRRTIPGPPGQPDIDAANFPAQTHAHMPSLTLKPTHKAVTACYDSLAKFAALP